MILFNVISIRIVNSYKKLLKIYYLAIVSNVEWQDFKRILFNVISIHIVNSYKKLLKICESSQREIF